jgi:hypothetical protein
LPRYHYYWHRGILILAFINITAVTFTILISQRIELYKQINNKHGNGNKLIQKKTYLRIAAMIMQLILEQVTEQ